MKRIIHLSMTLLLLGSCLSNSNKKPVGNERVAIDFPLDSLLSFNSEKELKIAFGNNVERGKGRYPGMTEKYNNTLLFLRSKNEVEFVWEDDTLNYTKLVLIKIYGKSNDWKTKEGIALGTNIKQLEIFNKKPFTFYGLEWDYSGEIQWNDGFLGTRRIYGSLTYPDDIMPNKFNSLIGDDKFESSSEIAQKAGLILNEIVMMKD